MAEVRVRDREQDRVWTQTPSPIWARVKALHAQWQVENPRLRLNDTIAALFNFGLKQPDRVWEEEMAHDRDDT